MAVLEGLKRVWDVFTGQLPMFTSVGPSTSGRSGQSPARFIYNDRSIVSSVYTRIAIDVSGVMIKHVRVDEKGRYASDMPSDLNWCLTYEPNIDQAPRDWRQDVCMTMFDRGDAALAAVQSVRDPLNTRILDVQDIRVGEITQYHPYHVRANVWDEKSGIRKEVLLEKRFTPIVYNPLAPIMNAPNSTMQRLIHKLRLLDTVDEAASSGKLDLIIQLPYVVKSDARRQQANQRRQEIEVQMTGSKYGIAYVDATEKITQLNRPAENQLLDQVKYLVDMVYGQLGITPEVMNGTADEAIMLNYYARTVYPIVEAIVGPMNKTWVGREGIENQEQIRYFRKPFEFVTMAQFADIADKLRRNEVATSNELRDVIGFAPSDDEQADKLSNPNMP